MFLMSSSLNRRELESKPKIAEVSAYGSTNESIVTLLSSINSRLRTSNTGIYELVTEGERPRLKSTEAKRSLL
jgi:hypothetical protein